VGGCGYQSLDDTYDDLTTKWTLIATGVAHERETDGDLVVRDMGHGMPFRPATFDAAIRYALSDLHLAIWCNAEQCVCAAVVVQR
jgi:hypothetical protein